MSNALELNDDKVRFSPEEIDFDALHRLLAEAEKYSKTAAAQKANSASDATVPDDPFGEEGGSAPPAKATTPPRPPEEEERENVLNATASHLVGAVRFRKDPMFRNDFVEIAFKKSRYTWREFRWVLNHVIRPLIRKSKTHGFLVADTQELLNTHPKEQYDVWGTLEVDFQKGIE